MEPLISIVVPVYNAEKYIEKCITSILSQTYNRIELVLVDDGASDGSAAICKSFADMDQRVVYLHQENCGVSVARNLGICSAKGEYITFCDSDDWMESDMCHGMISMAMENKADVVITSFSHEKNALRDKAADPSVVLKFTGKESILEMHRAKYFEGQFCGKLFKRNLFNNVTLDQNIAIFEDLLALWDIFLKAENVIYCGIPYYHYVINDASALNQKYRPKDWDRRKACLKMKEKAEESFPEAVVYVQKTLIMADVQLIEKLAMNRAMTPVFKKQLIEEIRMLYPKVEFLLTPDRKKRVRMAAYLYPLFVARKKTYYFLRKIKRKVFA